MLTKRALAVKASQEWLSALDRLASELGLPNRTAVVDRALAVLANQVGLTLPERYPIVDSTPHRLRDQARSRPLPGQQSLAGMLEET